MTFLFMIKGQFNQPAPQMQARSGATARPAFWAASPNLNPNLNPNRNLNLVPSVPLVLFVPEED
jgi:hypothetical protein